MTGPRFERALVTGASSGIGREMAVQLATDGSDLVLVARREARLEEIAGQARLDHGVEAEVLPADLADDGDLAMVAERLDASSHPVDLLVNNAGVSQHGYFQDLDVDRAELQIDVNMQATLHLTHAALPGMQARRRGAVLMVASTAAFQPMPRMATYGATKAFLLSFGQALTEELRGSGVTVSVLCPGFTDTAFVGEDHGIPGPLLMAPEDVARAGLVGAGRGRAVVTPGVQNKAHRAVATALPSALLRRAAGTAV